jgi:hypothetical protein
VNVNVSDSLAAMAIGVTTRFRVASIMRISKILGCAENCFDQDLGSTAEFLAETSQSISLMQ